MLFRVAAHKYKKSDRFISFFLVMADGAPEAKRACRFDVVAEEAVLCETESEDAQNGKSFFFVNEFAKRLARAITGSTDDDPLGRLAELADSRKVLTVPREFYVTCCPDLPDWLKRAESITLDDFLILVDKTLIAHVIDTDKGRMSGRYCIQDLVHIRSTPTYA
jgi:hypothetical protein